MRRAIAFISERWREQPETDAIAEAAGVTATELHHLFRRWAGLTPKAFLQALTLDHARRLLREFGERARCIVRSRALRTGAAARSVRHPRGDVAGRMEIGRRRPDYLVRAPPLAVRHGAGDGDRARACGSSLCRSGRRAAALADMRARWPRASYLEDAARTAALAQRIFDPDCGAPSARCASCSSAPISRCACGRRCLRSRWAGRRPTRRSPPRSARIKAARAVGAAVGRNPVSFVVPCHRVLGKSGDITGYHWGLTRKRAMLGWEAGRLAAA